MISHLNDPWCTHLSSATILKSFLRFKKASIRVKVLNLGWLPEVLSNFDQKLRISGIDIWTFYRLDQPVMVTLLNEVTREERAKTNQRHFRAQRQSP